MRVPTYEKETVIEKYVTTTIEYPTADGFFPNLFGGFHNFKLSIPSGEIPTKLTLVSTENITRDTIEGIELSIISNTVGRVSFNRFHLIDSNNKKFSITFNEYWEEAGLETVFKVKYNGTAYEKIKLNGTIITPKA